MKTTVNILHLSVCFVCFAATFMRNKSQKEHAKQKRAVIDDEEVDQS